MQVVYEGSPNRIGIEDHVSESHEQTSFLGHDGALRLPKLCQPTSPDLQAFSDDVAVEVRI